MKRFILTSFLALVFILSETRFSSGPTTTNGLTDEQRKEIESLRTQLDDAFEKDDERTLKAHGVITQPGWTQNDKTPHNSKSKVVVTKSGLDEAKALRDEINTAVKQDQYTPIVSSSNIGANTEVIQELHRKYAGNDNNKKSKQSDIVSSNMPAKGPNLIESTSANDDPDIDIRKLQRLELSKRRTREMLILESIEEDFSFNLGEHVQEWEHIIHGGQEFFIGCLEQDLQIVHKNALKYEASEMVHIGSPITYLETYTFWNAEQKQQEGIIIVATGNQVLWYRADEKRDAIALYWEWVVGSAISGLTYFTADGLDYLVVSSNQSSRAGYYALNIYQFDLKNKEFWITQRLQLSDPCSEVTLINTGRDYILAVPQNNTAVIYTFNPHTEASGHVHFQRKYSFDSEGIQYITAFQMGGRSYLALGGMQPQILLYQQGEFIPKTIFGNNFGFVEFFFPIPVRTYRDDLILLVQHRVDFSTHKLTVLETLIWDGEAFEATIPAPCKLGAHTVHGVNCMLDIKRDAGLKGAALLRRGDEVSVIVPRHEAESGLFRLHTKLLAKNSELKDLQEIFEFLKEWVAEQDALIAQAQRFLEQPMDEPNFDNLELQLLKTPELFFTGALKELYVNDYKWTKEDSAMDLNHIINEIETLEHELSLSRHKRETEEFAGHSVSFASLDFDNVEAEFLEFENLNDAPFYIQNGVLDFEGILNVVDLEVLESEHLQEARQAMLDVFAIENDLEFEEINGIPWLNITDNLIFQDSPLELENLEVEQLIVKNQLEIEKLNSLNFPGDYLFTEDETNPIVYAQKTFVGTLTAHYADTEGNINNKNPLDMIPLIFKQEWTGTPTFADLEVSEIFELKGKARGPGLEDFPRNPTLEDSKIITANCEFANLKVLGPIKIEDNFNNEPFGNLLSEVIQRPEDPHDEIRVTAVKTFTNVEFPIDFHILDNKINNITIDQFVPSQTAQELGLSLIDGYVYFGNLTITGSYDGIMIDEFMRNAIRIDQAQNLTNTQLNFPGFIKAGTVNIVKTLNGVPLGTGYQTVLEDLVTPKAYFQILKTEEAHIAGDIKGDSKFNGLKLNEYLKKRNSTDFVQKTDNIFVNELILEAGLQVDEINGLNVEFLYEFLAKIDSLPEMVLDGIIHIDRITVSGNVQLNKLNGHHFDDDIQLTAVWLNRPNYLSTTLQFLETTDLQAELNVLGDYNNENLPEHIDDMVFRNLNGTVLILAPKKFTGYVQVLGNTEVDALNGMPFNEYANKRSSGIFERSLKINGNLIVQELAVNGAVNDFPVEELSNKIRFDQDLEGFVLRGVTNLKTPLKLFDLTVYGDLNEFKNLKEFFENLIYKKGNCLLYGQYNFTGRVSIENDVYIGNLNGQNLLEILNNIVYINGLEPTVITSPVNFMSAVKASTMNIQGTLKTTNIDGYSIKSWLKDTLNVKNSETIKNHLNFAPESLHGNSIFASFLNDIDLSKIITLNTPQTLNETQQFSEVYLDGTINVTGTINGVDLQTEFENTLLTTGNQHIRTPLTLHTVNVLENLQTREAINGDKQLEQVATLYEDLEFESPFFFKELRAENVFTEDLISGIDFDDWYKFALWKAGRAEHRISGNWSVQNLSLKNGPSMPEFIENKARTVSGEQSFRELCQKLKNLLFKHSKKSYALKHISKAFELDLNNYNLTSINNAFTIQDYLLVNAGCNSTIFKWNAFSKNYKFITNFESGLISQLAAATDKTLKNEVLKFITNAEEDGGINCTFFGSLNLWQLKEHTLEHLKNFNENATEIWAAGSNGHIFAITDKGVKKISTTTPYVIESLNFNDTFKTENYISVEQHLETKIIHNNSTHFTKISQDPKHAQRHRRALPIHFSHLNNYPRSIHPLLVTDESILKPNATILHKLTFADFSHIIERILEDLDYRLAIEINITQLSIPESDLYDSHLIQDFMAIIDELRSQEIYPINTFDDVKLESIQIPENPAQVLAARTVQIVWPVIVEIDEIQRYLRGNSTAEQPICACILNHLGIAIKEVLALANGPTKLEGNDTIDYTSILSAVINRIREFQKDLKDLETELKLEISEDLNSEIENKEKINNDQKDQFKKIINTNDTTNKSKDEDASGNYSLRVHKYPKTYNIERNELLSLKVGIENNYNTLMAVTHAQSHLAPSQAGGINLYADLLENKIFQFIPAYKPRSMATLRVRDITLLAYIEHCCTVNVLQYRGVEGFVNFAKIISEVPIIQVMGISLPHTDFGNRYYFVTTLSHKLIFYEVVFTGLKEVPAPNLLNCN